jgi:hypothetical protein
MPEKIISTAENLLARSLLKPALACPVLTALQVPLLAQIMLTAPFRMTSIQHYHCGKQMV